MKKIVFFSILFPFIAFNIHAQQVRVTHGNVGWRELGTTVVKFTVDKDVIVLAGNDWFRQLKFHVADTAVEMLNMTVVYETGVPQNIPLRFVIPRGGESRLIDLNGGERRLRRVEFTYKSGAPGYHGNAKVILFGLK
ncbi:hypothetical protein QEG73_03540 [Chitinophagaceae bacterium 26-R-25]|nr:hypothetical protein [Chitinophagaceae bacterium 26-R-25]